MSEAISNVEGHMLQKNSQFIPLLRLSETRARNDEYRCLSCGTGTMSNTNVGSVSPKPIRLQLAHNVDMASVPVSGSNSKKISFRKNHQQFMIAQQRALRNSSAGYCRTSHAPKRRTMKPASKFVRPSTVKHQRKQM